MAEGSGEAEISFQEELLKGGLAKISKSGVECPNRIAFTNAERIAQSSKDENVELVKENASRGDKRAKELAVVKQEKAFGCVVGQI